MKNKKIIINILIPILIGTIIGLVTKDHPVYFESNLMPPKIVFPIAWTILYGLLGYSYSLLNSNKLHKIYWVQLLVNFMWPIVFFKFQWFLFSFIWILLLDILVIIMIIKFYKDNNLSAYLNIPYLLWLIFATILCYSTYTLN